MTDYKFLALVRHAKAEDENEGGDFHRKLTKKGLTQAEHAAQMVLDRLTKEKANLSNCLIETSSAMRTTETATFLGLAFGVEYASSKLLYNADAQSIIDRADELLSGAGTVLLVGHNPGISIASTQISRQYVSLKPSEGIVVKYIVSETGEHTLHQYWLLEREDS